MVFHGSGVVKLKKREIDALACPPGRRDMIVFDDDLPGFGLRVTGAGAKTFVLQYQLGGRSGRRTRLVIGPYGEITPAEARRQAEVARAQVRLGKDPASERKALVTANAAATAAQKQAETAAAFTVRKLIEQWASDGLADRSAVHRIEAPRALSTTFAALLDHPAKALDAVDIQRLLDEVAKLHPVTARRSRDYGRAAYNWALGRKLVDANPFISVVLDVREISRDRALSDIELGEAWRAAESTAYPFGPLVQLLILTLQRRGEVAGMRWPEVSDDFSTWTIPKERAKNGKAHLVHLAEPARAVLRGITRQDGRDMVFTTNDRRPVSGFSKAADELKDVIAKGRPKPAKGRTALPPLDWTWHDFRRTGVTGLARIGVSVDIADRLLNHVQGATKGIKAVYQRHEFIEERGKALDAWAGHVLSVAHSVGK